MKAPTDLGPDGAALFRRIEAFLEEQNLIVDPHEEAVLVEGCRVADRLAQLRSTLDGAEFTDAATVRMLAEERQQRVALSTLLITRLGLPTGLADAPSTPRSRRAQKAARSRWDRRLGSA